MKYSLTISLIFITHLLFAGSKERNKKYTLREIDTLGLLDKLYERDVNTFINSILHYPNTYEGKPSKVVYESDSFVYFGHDEEYTTGDFKTKYIRKVNKKKLQSAFPHYNKVNYNDIKNTIKIYFDNNKALYDSLIGNNYRQLNRGPDYTISNNYLLIYMPYLSRGFADGEPSRMLRFYLDDKKLSIAKVEQLPQPYTMDFLKDNVDLMSIKHLSTKHYLQYFFQYGCSKKYGGCIENMFEKGNYVYFGYPFEQDGKKVAYTIYKTNTDSLKAILPGYQHLKYETIDKITKPCWDTVAKHYDDLRKRAGLSTINYDKNYYTTKYDGEYITVHRVYKLKSSILNFITLSRYYYTVYIDKKDFHIVHTSRTIK